MFPASPSDDQICSGADCLVLICTHCPWASCTGKLYNQEKDNGGSCQLSGLILTTLNNSYDSDQIHIINILIIYDTIVIDDQTMIFKIFSCLRL